jgi:hypothetical protein
MSSACSMHVEGEKYARNFVTKSYWKRSLGRTRRKSKDRFKIYLRDVRMGKRLIWLKMRSSIHCGRSN